MSSGEAETGPRRPPRAVVLSAGAVAVVAVAAFAAALSSGDPSARATVHRTLGTVWTALVLVVGFGVTPLLWERSAEGRARVAARLVGATLPLFPPLAAVTLVGGVQLALAYGLFDSVDGLMGSVLAVAVAVAALAFGIVLPTDLRLYRELHRADPDVDRVAALATRSATALTVQGSFQLTMLFLMYRLAGRVS